MRTLFFPQIEMKQFLIYCDPYIAEMENCCELLEPKVRRFDVSSQREHPPLKTGNEK